MTVSVVMAMIVIVMTVAMRILGIGCGLDLLGFEPRDCILALRPEFVRPRCKKQRTQL